ncbi:restriction endonuclease subunit S [Aliarcobacter cryaerophilus]|uniref:restriction endonuclease subunit S n=1 Tax=Aliarcobacter cryaerophilus TaxID=28198 RepID=UPI000A8FFD3B|nr:restriction endonuclease subunit S [Aliarcobacter cryaerophilus]
MTTSKFKFKDIVSQDKGFLRGPFGGDLKKEIFVPKDNTTYKVYEQGVVLQKDESIGKYYISKEYYDKKMYKFEVKPKDFLVSCSGVNYGAIYQLRENAESGVINQALLRIRLNNKVINDDFFYYYFNFYLVNLIVGKKGDSTIPNFPPISVIKELEFNLPNIAIQEKIGYFLKNIDSKIELNNKINKELESMAKTLYDYWFVQFDFPDENGKPYKSSGGKMVYNQELKRDIPDGWEVKTISEFIGNNKGGDWGKEQEEGNYTQKVSCIRGADLNGLNGLGELNPPERFILDKNSNKILESHDLIVEISGGSPTQSTGRLSFVIDETITRFENPLICSNFCKSFSLKNSKHFYYFIYMWNNLYDNSVLFGWEGKTSGIKNLLFDSFTQKYFVVVPNESINQKFYEKINSFHKMKQKKLKENQELAKLRDWLLPMLMNGQVRVDI